MESKEESEDGRRGESIAGMPFTIPVAALGPGRSDEEQWNRLCKGVNYGSTGWDLSPTRNSGTMPFTSIQQHPGIYRMLLLLILDLIFSASSHFY
ncbi:hypothetical protein Tco_0782565 [Tanacetum coccineum]